MVAVDYVVALLAGVGPQQGQQQVEWGVESGGTLVTRNDGATRGADVG